jgi:NAD(P)H-hydrate epimerase
MGTAEITQAGLLHFLEFSKQKMVLDADALNIISNNKEIISRLPHHTILTPHPKEFDRLFGDQQNEWERIQTAMMQAKALQMIIILKGHRSLIALPDGRGYFNQTGNAGLAKGGSGDVLTGMITAFLAQGYTQEQAALLGVYLHGLAADEAIRSIAEESLLASDVIASISQAFKLIKMF